MLSLTLVLVHPAKAVGRIEMPFDRDTRVVPSNIVLDTLREVEMWGSEPLVLGDAAYYQINLAFVFSLYIKNWIVNTPKSSYLLCCKCIVLQNGKSGVWGSYLATCFKYIYICALFLQGVSVAASPVLAIVGKPKAVCPSVCHTLALSENDAS